MKQYINQVDSFNFVYPNNTIAEYDTEIIHQLNNNTVTGVVNSFSNTYADYSHLAFDLNYTWIKNGAEPFLLNDGTLSLVSVHMMTSSQQYFKPWRMVTNISNPTTTLTGTTATASFVVYPSNLGVSSFTTGKYYFDIRFIGQRSIYPVCTSLNITIT